ncbi:MAG TPA: DUF2520 domain-containing protein [Acidimicrobiales bacterium]|nr:DUF2520 domain-containing protein [Acidimicrobiales bacterium]
MVGLGRAGGSFAAALTAVGWHLDSVFTRGMALADAAVDVDVVIIATPDRAIAEVARAIRAVDETAIVHLSGACGLDVLAPHTRRASVHALMTLPDVATGAARLPGGWFAIAGDAVARELVVAIAGRSFVVADDERARYHAAASVASNHLVVLLGQVERLAARAGVPFAAFLPLIRASVENVEALGSSQALTGPAARGDEETIERHLRAIDESERPLYRVLSNAARTLASSATTPREGE